MTRNKFTVMAGQVHIEPAPDAEHLIARLAPAGVIRDEDYGAWVLPATPLVASLIRETFSGVGKVQTDVAFRNLLKLADDPTAAAIASKGGSITFNTPLWDHQAEGVKLAKPNPGFVFGYEPGAGKTLTAFRTIAERGHQKILTFAPKRVLSTWVDQAERHTEGLAVRAFGKGDIKRRVKEMQGFLSETEGVPSVSVINYESIDQKGAMRDFLVKQDWDLLIADECHRIKSAGGTRSRWLATLGKRVPYRLGLTGTLLPHSPLDVYGQYRMIDPRVFGTNYAAFKGRYMNMHPLFPDTLLNVKPEMAEEFQRRIHSIAHFVKTVDVLDLPEMLPLQRIEVELEPSARKIYKEIEEEFWSEVEDGQVTASNILVKIIRLQQITSGWLPLDDGRLKQVSQAKERALADLLSDIDPQEPVVVFCRFHQDLDAIGMVAADISGRKYAEISGRVGEEGYTAWKEGRANIIGIQIQAGGEGLNDLVNSRILIYYNVTYSLGVYTQSQARLQRPGQIRNVAEYHLVASDTIDEKILRALSERRDLVASILERGRDA
jgi:SNF2 family DNA or RNA helicase